MWWYIVELKYSNGQICNMYVTKYGMPCVMGQQLIWLSLYFIPSIKGTFLMSAIGSWIILIVLIVSFFVLWGVGWIIKYIIVSCSCICDNCGHIEERQNSDLNIEIVISAAEEVCMTKAIAINV
jgi:hypothetical protein